MSIINDALKKTQLAFKRPKKKEKAQAQEAQDSPKSKDDEVVNVYDKLYKAKEDKTKSSTTHIISEKKLIEQCENIGNRLLAGKVNLNPLKETSVVFDAKELAVQIRRMEQSINTDPSLAIGTAKELIETCCKTILAERGTTISKSPDISNLTKDTLKALKLVPDGIPESARGSDVIKRLLNNLGTIGNSLAELRGLYGTGHGKDGKFEGLSPSHAKLAVGAASTLANFLFDTHKETMK